MASAFFAPPSYFFNPAAQLTSIVSGTRDLIGNPVLSGYAVIQAHRLLIQ
jgi:hypothetical protein